MAIELPDWLEPVLQLYGIPWPDIDEDAFHALQQPLRDFGHGLDAVGEAIETALQYLESGNPSRTLQAIQTYVQAIRRDFLSPINNVCQNLAGTPCDIAYDMVFSAKWALIGMLAGEIANDVADVIGTVVTLGLDSALTAGEALAVREAVSQSLSAAEGDIASAVISAANNYLDDFINSLVNPFINDVVADVEGAVNSYQPTFLLRQALGLEQAVTKSVGDVGGLLHLSAGDLQSCVQSIYHSADSLDSAEQALTAAIEEIFSRPAPNSPEVHGLSSDLRMALKGVMESIEGDLVAGVKTLIDHVVQHFMNLLEDYQRAINDLDEQGRNAAAKQRAGSGAPVVVLAAVGVGFAAAGRVDGTSGVINAEAVDEVRVGMATEEDAARSEVVRTEDSKVTMGVVSATGSVEESAALTQKQSSQPVSAAPTTSGQIDGVSARAGSAGDGSRPSGWSGMGEPTWQQPSSATDHLQVKHSGEVAPKVSRADSSAGSKTNRLSVKKTAETAPKVAKAESAAGSVKEVKKTGTDRSEPVVDASPTTGQSSDQ